MVSGVFKLSRVSAEGNSVLDSGLRPLGAAVLMLDLVAFVSLRVLQWDSDYATVICVCADDSNL